MIYRYVMNKTVVNKAKKPKRLTEAEYLVQCPSGITYACEKHKDKLVAVFSVLGYLCVVKPLIADYECGNCINEQKQSKKA